MTSANDPNASFGQLVEEFLERQKSGQRPSVEEYANAHPDLAERIREVFPALVRIGGHAASSNDPTTGYGDQGGSQIGATTLGRLGDYRIIREIGRGGMGIVYEAEQESLGRHVALKVLPTQALPDDTQVKRFRREAQAAARLHHTNIVPIYGVGQDGDIHYFVMQFIQGRGLDEVIEELRLLRHDTAGPGGDVTRPTSASQQDQTVGPRDATAGIVTQEPPTNQVTHDATAWLDAEEPKKSGDSTGASASDAADPPPEPADLARSAILLDGSGSLSGISSHSGRQFWERAAQIGADVGDALAYAHEQGVLHRDVKPSNLLLDVEGEVWITDFGLAKAVDQDDVTRTGDIVGTLRYMAPEQFRGESDARSDVYSLGLTLYELFALRPAYDETDRSKLMQQVMQAEAPPIRKVRPDVPHDLETIVHKAIDPQPNKRYQTAGELAEDLRRWLRREPILARRIGRLERLVRWSQRRPTAAALLALVLLITFVGFPGVTWLWLAAQRSAVEAEINFQRAMEAVDKMLMRVGDDRLANVPQMQGIRREVLEDALRFYQAFLKERGDDTRLQSETAGAYYRIGRLYELLGQHDQAQQAFRQAMALYESLSDGSGESPDHLLRLAESHRELGDQLRDTGRRKEAEDHYGKARRLFRGQFAHRPEFRQGLAHIESRLGSLLRGDGDWSGSEARLRAALETRRQLVQQFPDKPVYAFDLATSYADLGLVLENAGRLADAEKNFGQAREIREQLVAKFPKVARYRQYLASVHDLLSGILWKTGQRTQSLQHIQRSVDLRQKLAEDYPNVPDYKYGLADSLCSLAERLRNEGQHEDAQELHTRAIDVIEPLADEYAKVPRYRALLGSVYHGMAILHRARGQAQLAEASYRKALEARQKLAEDYPDDSQYARGVAHSYSRLASLLNDLGRLAEAEKLYAKAVETQGRIVASSPDIAESQEGLAVVLNGLGLLLAEKRKYTKARNVFRRAVKHQERALKPNPKHPGFLYSLSSMYTNLGNQQEHLGELADAESSFRRALETREHLVATYPEVARYHNALAATQHNLAIVLTQVDRRDEAERLYRSAISHQEQALKTLPLDKTVRTFLANHHYSLALLLQSKEELIEAETHFRKATEIRERLVKDFPKIPQIQERLCSAYFDHAELLTKVGRREEAVPKYRRALEIRSKLASAFPEVARYRVRLGIEQFSLAEFLDGLGKKDEAATAYQQAIRQLQDALQVEPKNRTALDNQGLAYYYLAKSFQENGELDKARGNFRNAVVPWATLVEVVPDSASYQFNLALAAFEAGLLMRQPPRELTESAALLRRAVEANMKAVQLEPKNETRRKMLQHHYVGLMDGYIWLEDHKRLAEAARDYQKNTRGMLITGARYLGRAAMIAEADKDLSEAEQKKTAATYRSQAREFLKLVRKNVENNPAGANILAWFLATTIDEKLRDPQEAIRYAEEAVAGQAIPGHINTLGVAHYRAGNLDEAIKYLEEARSQEKGDQIHNWAFLAMAYARQGNLPEAHKWYEKTREDIQRRTSVGEELQQFWREATMLVRADH